MTQARGRPLFGVFLSLALASCARAPAQPPSSPRVPQTALQPIDVPASLPSAPLPRTRVASGLANPRGIHVASDGSLLVAVAGTGDPGTEGSGGLLKLRDLNQDGDFDDPGERSSLLEGQPSKNLIELVRRDEVFGMAAVDEGGGSLLASLALFGGPSTIFRIEGERVVPWGHTHANANDLAYDPRRNVWLAVASTTDEVVELLPGGRAERVVKIPPLANGQDPVPAYLRFDPVTGDMLVTLFSGSPEGEEGGAGVELVPRAASIVRVHAESRRIEPVVTGLSVPTDLEIAADGSIYVLEFCDAFLDPAATREELLSRAMHGGFRRFSGRLLHVDRARRSVEIVAQGLDAPTNLARSEGALWIAQGMGTPGRQIPGVDGRPVPLTGFIERLALH
jgi:hypothetical protein